MDLKKRQFVPDSSIPSASYLEHSVFPALNHSPLCLQGGAAASQLRRDGRWRDTQQERGRGNKKNQQTLKACLSSLNSSQGKADKVDKAAERGQLAGEELWRFFASWLLYGPSTLTQQTSGKSGKPGLFSPKWEVLEHDCWGSNTGAFHGSPAYSLG